ncbi:hypothetical protein [Eubacterium oxidoreducens]|uniref:tRNA_anti-like n=1 Tax=Eubacterium oxidoreducens TaxID=1732 RepID=A0A1G6AXJ1_EUBOX|nr:hypothetical protein [Eubacterium oxidoreducens]SDB13034.1 hypothetical protein SAMN02910417_00996 [Eubacterium oxidoreducens]
MRKKIWGMILAAGMMTALLGGCASEDATSDTVSEEAVSDTQTESDAISEEESTVSKQEVSAAEGIDVDLTQLSSTMVYSEVYNMMLVPDEYIGKTVKMNGAFTTYENEETGQIYYACIIQDATACCSQGIEFELAGDYTYPDDYPQEDTEIVVQGTFETYEEDGLTYCRLADATME